MFKYESCSPCLNHDVVLLGGIVWVSRNDPDMFSDV